MPASFAHELAEFQVADFLNNVLRRIAGGMVTTLTGWFFYRGSQIFKTQ
jgi:hypothetical protein